MFGRRRDFPATAIGTKDSAGYLVPGARNSDTRGVVWAGALTDIVYTSSSREVCGKLDQTRAVGCHFSVRGTEHRIYDSGTDEVRPVYLNLICFNQSETICFAE